MDSPVVTTCSSTSNGTMGSSSTSAEAGSQHRQAYHLRIDAGSFNSSRTYEELPENFLETISPQQSNAPSSSLMMNEHSSSPQLAPLAPMSMASEQSGSYMMGIGGPNQYSSHSIEKNSFGNGPAGLLSPLHLDSRRQMAANDYGAVYIKEETDSLEQGGHHLLSLQSQIPMSSQQQELDRIGQAETPPAVSNVELASTMIATLIGEQRSTTPPNHNSYTGGPSSLMQQRIQNMKHDAEEQLEGIINGDGEVEYQTRQSFAPKGARRVYSTKDSSDPLNAELDDDVYIDTKDLCKRIAYELKQHSIPQAIFAERILCRSQGTLSDLLRNPKPWNKLKSGRETFRRMFNWIQQPLAMRLGILDLYKTEGPESETVNNGIVKAMGMAPPTPAQNVRNSARRSNSDDGPANKRPRLVFTDIQKRTLQAIFKETQRPSREMQQTIAEHLRLDLSTVANFFMNARRRSRVGPLDEAGPAPYQMVHNVSPPPPDSPTRVGIGSRRRVPANMQHIEATVSSVAGSGMYGRGISGQDSLEDDDTYKMYKNDETLGDDETLSIIAGQNDQDWSDNHVEVVHSESLTPLEDSPVDVVERVKQEDEGVDDIAA